MEECAIEAEHKHDKHSTCSLGCLRHSRSVNVIPEKCDVSFDMRRYPGTQGCMSAPQESGRIYREVDCDDFSTLTIQQKEQLA